MSALKELEDEVKKLGGDPISIYIKSLKEYISIERHSKEDFEKVISILKKIDVEKCVTNKKGERFILSPSSLEEWDDLDMSKKKISSILRQLGVKYYKIDKKTKYAIKLTGLATT